MRLSGRSAPAVLVGFDDDSPHCRLSAAEDTCAEVDHGCEHICANLPDGHECRCRPGYELTVDGKTCNSSVVFYTFLPLFLLFFKHITQVRGNLDVNIILLSGDDLVGHD